MALSQLSTACQHAGDFPIRDTFLGDYPFEHHLHSHFGRLNEREKSKLKLFCSDEADSELYFIEFEGEDQGNSQGLYRQRNHVSKHLTGSWRSKCIESLAGLERHLGVASLSQTPQKDPRCRFLLVSILLIAGIIS